MSMSITKTFVAVCCSIVVVFIVYATSVPVTRCCNLGTTSSNPGEMYNSLPIRQTNRKLCIIYVIIIIIIIIYYRKILLAYCPKRSRLLRQVRLLLDL